MPGQQRRSAPTRSSPSHLVPVDALADNSASRHFGTSLNFISIVFQRIRLSHNFEDVESFCSAVSCKVSILHAIGCIKFLIGKHVLTDLHYFLLQHILGLKYTNYLVVIEFLNGRSQYAVCWALEARLE